jgi:hypothetical protein
LPESEESKGLIAMKVEIATQKLAIIEVSKMTNHHRKKFEEYD